MKTNEQKVDEYFAEIEKVFGNKEQMVRYLDNYDLECKEGTERGRDAYEMNVLGRHHKEYWVKFEVKEPNQLNTFMMAWVVMGYSIAGVKGSVLDFGGVCDKNEFKQKMHKYIEEL